nr:MAG TPA: hypothetical protein [Caudoviricetes sp.]
MDDYISRKAAIDYIRGQSDECQKAFEELGGESGIYADAYNDLAEDFYSIPAADVAPVVRCLGCKHWDDDPDTYGADDGPKGKCMKSFETMYADDFCSYGERKDGGG